MLRSTFFAAGLFIALWGVSFLFVDKIVLNISEEPLRPSGFRGLFTSITPAGKKVLDPPDWTGFSLISIGTVTMLYAVALPKKQNG